MSFTSTLSCTIQYNDDSKLIVFVYKTENSFSKKRKKWIVVYLWRVKPIIPPIYYSKNLFLNVSETTNVYGFFFVSSEWYLTNERCVIIASMETLANKEISINNFLFSSSTSVYVAPFFHYFYLIKFNIPALFSFSMWFFFAFLGFFVAWIDEVSRNIRCFM